MRDKHASKESSAEPDAIRSMFFVVPEALAEAAADPVLMDEFVEVIDGPDVDFISWVGLDELMDEPDEGIVSSLAQPVVSRAMNATMPAILAITGLINHSSVLRWIMDKEKRVPRWTLTLHESSRQQQAKTRMGLQWQVSIGNRIAHCGRLSSAERERKDYDVRTNSDARDAVAIRRGL